MAAFIEAAIPSVWALEALIVLKRDPDIGWATDDLVAEMRASATLVTDCILVLQRAGLVIEHSGSVRYAPASPALAGLADALQGAYRQRPVAVVNWITARRSDPLKGFADSFRLGGWKA
ncbi:hypothetical protein [Brevundimonas sp.]|uniref:hypothetical protein n=1 Tax=Brevundimonas sp. TaxID=1871086 RepID=UPI002FC9C17D